jgi:uncharacterized protein (TIGR02118 family)
MIKIVYCITRREDIEAGEFHRYWLEEHGPLVKSVAGDIGASRYVQSHTTLPELNAVFQKGRGLESPYDGITEIWWESEEAMIAGTESPAGQAAAVKLVEDESRFIDFSRSRLFMTEEHEIF